MVGKLLDFLFGKNPDIFDAHGTVVHKLPPEKWKAWKDRFESGEYDWRQHRGTKREIKTQ
ncbi:MAG TPA: hypothetical protein PKC28_13875 [Bdellovibrionales bacterium]|nr:hypothetical protein [Bdellovibrionales bacterium]